MDPQVSFPQNWTAPSELRRALPREVQLSAVGMFLSILAVCLVIGAGVLFVTMRNLRANQLSAIAALRDQGLESPGRIVKLWREGKNHTPEVSYDFEAGGRRYQGDCPAPEKVWEFFQEGGPIPIRYLPSDPKVNHPAGWPRETIPGFVPFMFPAMCLFGVAAILLSLRYQSSILTDGLPAPGVVTKCFRVKGGWAVRYSFRTKDGAVLKGRSQVSSRTPEGSELCILYLPENPRRSRPYPLKLYKLADN